MKALPTPHTQALLTELDDGTGVVLHLDTKFYYTLNATGVFVWKQLAAGPAGGIDDIARGLAERFEVTEAQAGDDVRALLSELRVEGLVVGG